MTIETIQLQLAEQISNHNKIWGNLLANLDFGNEAPSYWDVKLKPTHIFVDRINKNFTFKNAAFTFDVNSGVSYGDDHSLFTKQLSGRGTFLFINKTIQLQTLILNKALAIQNK